MNAKLWIDIGLSVKDVYGHIDTLSTHSQAIERAVKGQEPYPSKPSVETMLKKLEELARSLDELARSGIGKHESTPVSMAELADPATKMRAVAKFRAEVSERDRFLEEGKKVQAEVERLAREAPLRAAALRQMRDFFKDLVQGPVFFVQADAFTYYQLFERAAGRMGSVGTSATRAANRIRGELMQFEQDTTTLRSNLQTFGLL